MVQVKLVAHSMGAIVANEMLHSNRDLYFPEVVYLGPAATIKEFADQAIPYLKAKPTTQFYVHTLHPARESGNYNGFGLLPRGSLLAWIDSFLTEPRTDLDKTMGSWNNLMRALPVMHFLEGHERQRLHVYGFGVDEPDPQRHGDLNDPLKEAGYEFWHGRRTEPRLAPSRCRAPQGRWEEPTAGDRSTG